MIKNIILLGPPGVGKGSQAEQISKNCGLIHISTGEIFREEIVSKSDLGKKVEEIVNSGHYVSDELTNEIVKKRLQKDDVLKSGFILDGYPRTINQVNFLNENNIAIDSVILLFADKDVIIKRLLNRGRQDDTLEKIKTRLEVYEKQTAPLIDFYEEKGIIVEVNSNDTIDKCWKRIEQKVF
ncbi:MAG: adenylate kinase [Mycoplasma sp.]|nr:adenylate kinase [Mycoplasma sp.]